VADAGVLPGADLVLDAGVCAVPGFQEGQLSVAGLVVTAW
jgi:hypothetical protein